MKLSIIIPVFNEEKTIVETVEKVIAVKIPDSEKEIIIVDDGSTDKTALKIKKLKQREVKVFSHPKNSGKGSAVKTGIENATGDYFIIQDADSEYNPKYIPKLFKPIQQNKTKVVFGTRLKRMPHLIKEEKTPRFLLHYFGNRGLSLLASLLYGQWLTDMETGYKIFPKEAVEKININSKSFNFEPEITAKLIKNGYRILEIPIATIPRGYQEGKKLRTFQDGIMAFWTLIKYRFLD